MIVDSAKPCRPNPHATQCACPDAYDLSWAAGPHVSRVPANDSENLGKGVWAWAWRAPVEDLLLLLRQLGRHRAAARCVPPSPFVEVRACKASAAFEKVTFLEMERACFYTNHQLSPVAETLTFGQATPTRDAAHATAPSVHAKQQHKLIHPRSSRVSAGARLRSRPGRTVQRLGQGEPVPPRFEVARCQRWGDTTRSSPSTG